MKEPTVLVGRRREERARVDFELTEEQRSWHDAAVEFAKKELCRDVAARDRSESFDRDGW